MDKMVQLFESGSLLENNASYAQVFTVILSLGATYMSMQGKHGGLPPAKI